MCVRIVHVCIQRFLMQYAPLELIFEIAKYLYVDDGESYCIFADNSTPLRLSCRIFYRHLYSRLPKQPLLWGGCKSVAETCPPYTAAEFPGCKSPHPYISVRGWTTTARRTCTYHCHCDQKHQFKRFDVWMMRDMASSLISQIQTRDNDIANFATLKVPSLEYLQKFSLFLHQCGVVLSRELSLYATRSAGSAETTVIYGRNMDFLLEEDDDYDDSYIYM